jgi:uncharacterized glyoxalase superfamily metalloenzyme YdcJ
LVFHRTLGTLAFVTFEARNDRSLDGSTPPDDVAGLPDGGWVTAHPIVYGDFLPRSAAGIFQSNLSGDGSHDADRHGADLGASWMAGVLDRELADPTSLYAGQRERSLDHVRRVLRAPIHLTRS